MTDEELYQAAGIDDLNLSKEYYSIGEVASMLGEETSAVRHWVNNCDLFNLKRSGKGNRLFRLKDVRNIFALHYLVRVEHVKLKGAALRIKEMKYAQKEASADDDLSKRDIAIRKLMSIREWLSDLEKTL
ncbi:MAG: MerR family transcriptional regulator [Bacteroidales bacterium]|nr:MerR family transcriptional regulator [Bacteroidales bacterium]